MMRKQFSTILCIGPCHIKRHLPVCNKCILPMLKDEPCVLHPKFKQCPVFSGGKSTCMLPKNIVDYLEEVRCVCKNC